MRALIIVDVQNDFCPGGALAVPNGDEVVPAINSFIRKFPSNRVVATKDWHPSNHVSFQDQGGPWPPHCVQKTPGSELHDGLDIDSITIFYKGQFAYREDYSPFYEDNSIHTFLKARNIDELYVCGLATDYCVKAAVLDALELGYNVFVVTDACRGVDVTEGDSEKAFCEMEDAGARLIISEDV